MLLAPAAGVLGLLTGIVVNVVVRRVPAGLLLSGPLRSCPSCGLPPPGDDVPAPGWLRESAHVCAGGIRARPLLVELGCAALFAVVAVRFGLDPVLPAYLYFVAVGLALALIDLDHRRLPDVLTLPSHVVAAALLGAAALAGSETGELGRAALGGLVARLLYEVLHRLNPAGMGRGDVKLSGVLGLYLGWLGWPALVEGLFLAFLLGSVVGVLLLVLRRADRKSGLPFGPFMLAGALVAVLTEGGLFAAYLASV